MSKNMCKCNRTYKNEAYRNLPVSVSVLMAILPGEPGSAGFIAAKDDGSGSDNWSYETCTAPVGNTLCMISVGGYSEV